MSKAIRLFCKQIRSLLVHLDHFLLKEKVRNFYHFNLMLRSLNADFTHRIIANYNHSPSRLHELFYQYGSDKGAPHDAINNITGLPAHSYADLYLILFGFSRNDVRRLFECGLGTNNTEYRSNMGKFGRPGASLRAWRDYFPNAEIYGADIDEKSLFSENRIKTFYVDQTDSGSIVQMWESIGVADFDIIIDDGLHTFEAAVSLFVESFEYLRDGGLYVIEDIQPKDKAKFEAFFANARHRFLTIDLHRPLTRLLDNSVILIWKSKADASMAQSIQSL